MRMHYPPEWTAHQQTFVGWPSHAELWESDLAQARAEVAGLVRALATRGRMEPTGAKSEPVHVVAADWGAATSALSELADLVPSGRVAVRSAPFGDIWLRDTAPLFGFKGHRLTAQAPRFNGWGGKYDLPGDDRVGAYVAGASGADLVSHSVVLEGGAIDWDDSGTVMTTRECLLNPNRNAGWRTERDAEAFLIEGLGFSKVIWIDEGLLNDHTDGHVDNIARFAAPGVVVVQSPSGRADPHAARLKAIAAALEGQTDAAGRTLRVVEIPSPGKVLDAEGEVSPASHMNFVFGRGVIVVPTYEGRFGPRAVRALKPLFPGRRVIGLPSNAILSGGGSFHCITKQVPKHLPVGSALSLES